MGWVSRDMVAAIGLLALAVAGWWQTASLPSDAAMFPRLALSALAVLALVYLVRSLLRARRAQATKPLFKNAGRFVLAFALIAIYVAVFPRIGFFTATLVFIPVFVMAMGMRRAPLIAIATLAYTVVTYVLFVVLLNRPLPDDLIIGLMG
ncbi:MAG: hypothetical protein Tsb0032_03650 [Kiloniellaceae bacterium]